MTYTEIFDEVVSIMREDSSTCNDLGAGNFQFYKDQIKDDMLAKDFTKVVKRYIASFGQEGHLSFSDTEMGCLDFRVMRFENALYVTEAAETSTLKVKDKIVKIDGNTIETCASLNQEFLMGEVNERQGFLWGQILLFADKVTVERGGDCQDISIKLATTYEPNDKYSFKDLGNKTLLIKLLDFDDENAIRKVYQDCESLLETCENLIVDVRGNGGGSDTAFVPLFKYCYPADRKVEDYIPKQQPVAVNYSKRNCDSRIKMISEYFKDGIPEDIRPVVEQMKSDIAQNSGKGMIVEESSDEDEVLNFVGKETPKKVWIITDQNCASSGDAFVQDMSYSPKVTVVGRPTLGILDYSNCAVEMFDRFRMVYPTSRSGEIDAGNAMGHKGVPVDHYIPWTPMHLEKDVDLEYVLEQINKY